MDKPRAKQRTNGRWSYEHQGCMTWGRTLEEAREHWKVLSAVRANEEEWEIERRLIRDVDDGAPFIGGIPRAGYRRESMDRFSEVMLLSVLGMAVATMIYLLWAWFERLVL